MGRIVVTYDIVTPESAEDGDIAECGWEDEQGTECDWRAAVKLISDAGATEPSSWPTFHPGIWYSQADVDADYRTGEVKTLSYHLKGFTAREQYRVWSALRRSR